MASPAVFLKAKQRGLQYRPYLPSAGDVYGELTLIRLNDEQHDIGGAIGFVVHLWLHSYPA